MRRTVVLIVLDGWGIGRKDESNPIHTANLQTFNYLEENYPVTSLQASGISVGLPWGEIGNSEVGHLTLGAGKVLYQHYPRITLSIRDESFFQNAVFKNAFAHVRTHNSRIHFVGLLTKANVHASLDHLEALLKMATLEAIDRVQLHLFADGKDSPPHSLPIFLKTLPQDKVATLIGRYYAMDREENWNLTREAYETLLGKQGVEAKDALEALKAHYAKGLSEEFLPPLRLSPDAGIKDNDAIIFFNFREDGMQQLCRAFFEKDFSAFPREPLQNLFFATMTQYKKEFGVPVAYPPEMIESPLGAVLSEAGKNQLRLAETYKYAHVTFFFNGYRELPYKNEYRVLIPSLQTPHPDEHPAMMASAITDRLVQSFQNQAFDFILANYANADTVGHTGNYDAGITAAKTIDQEISRLLKASEGTPTVLLITSDHGNLEKMLDLFTGVPETQHDPNPVPFYLIGQEFKGRKFIDQEIHETETLGVLSDVTPTVLELMGLHLPQDMTGRSLLKDLR